MFALDTVSCNFSALNLGTSNFIIQTVHVVNLIISFAEKNHEKSLKRQGYVADQANYEIFIINQIMKHTIIKWYFLLDLEKYILNLQNSSFSLFYSDYYRG